MSAAWKPERQIDILAGTPPGGGLDRTARTLAAALNVSNVNNRVVNIPGDGARKVWASVDARAGDPHLLCISSPNLTTDFLTGIAAFNHDSYTPLAILYNEYIAFVTRSDSSYRSAGELLKRLRTDTAKVTVALSTAAGNPNHIALAQVTRHAGGDVRAPVVRVFDSALDAVADVVAHGGSLVVEAGTGVGKTFAYLVPALLSGERVLLSTATKALQDQLAEKDLPFLQAHMSTLLSLAADESPETNEGGEQPDGVLLALQVVQQATTLADHHQQAAARVEILVVRREMLGEVLDPLGENRNLHFRRTRVAFLGRVLGNDFFLAFGRDRHRYSPIVRAPL